MVLDTGLQPLRSAVAIEVALEHTSHGLCPLWTATRASSLGGYLTPKVYVKQIAVILS
jgi:hypothetical protein